MAAEAHSASVGDERGREDQGDRVVEPRERVDLCLALARRVAGVSEPMSPREVVEALMRGISDGRWEELDEFYADTAVVEYPFRLPAPLRIAGRREIRQ